MDLETLKALHPVYGGNLGLWNEIDMCMQPGIARNRAAKFCPQRPGEAPELYKARLERFAFTPLLSQAVRDLVKKLQTGTLLVDIDPPLLSEQNWLELAGSILADWVVYGVTYLMAVSVEGGLSFSTLAPTTVTNWSTDAAEPWFVFKTNRYTPLEKPGKVEFIPCYGVYQAGVVEYYREKGGKAVSLDTESAYITRCAVPENYWLAQFGVSKQIQHTWLENNMTDAAGNLYIQRVRKTPTDSGDLTDTYINSVTGAVVTSNSHVVEGDFQFVEASGSSVMTSLAVLTKLEEQLRQIFSLLPAGGNSNLSGESKRYDYAGLANTLVAFGSMLTTTLRDFLTGATQRLLGVEANIGVSGLDNFELNPLEVLLAQSEQLEKLPKLPDSVVRVWYARLSNSLIGLVDYELRREILADFVDWQPYAEKAGALTQETHNDTNSRDNTGQRG